MSKERFESMSKDNVVTLNQYHDEITQAWCGLEKAYYMIQYLSGDYFAHNKEEIEKQHGNSLVYHYDEARVKADIAIEYVYDSMKLLENTMEKLSQFTEQLHHEKAGK